MADEYGPFMDASTNLDTEFGFCTGVIRLDPGTVGGGGTFLTGGPYIHANSGHTNVGITGVSVDTAGRLVVTTDTVGAGMIGAPIVEEDETLSALGVQAGISGGNGILRIKLGQGGTLLNLTQQAAWNIVASEYSNLWILVVYVRHRGTGLPSKADRALADTASLQLQLESAQGTIAALQQRMTDAEAAIAAFEQS